MTEKTELPYKLIDNARQQRLRDFAGTDNPAGLEGEIALARLLQEEAVNEGNRGASIALLNTLAKLAQVSEAAKIRRGELMTKAAVLVLAQQIVGVLTQQVAGKFPGWEMAMDAAQAEILEIVCESKNPDIEEK